MSAKHPLFQKRHYASIASVLAKAKRRPNDSAVECLDDLERDLADLFARDNHKFRAAVFYAAADPEYALDREWKRHERRAAQ